MKICKPFCKQQFNSKKTTLARLCTFSNCQDCVYKGGKTCTEDMIPTVAPTAAPAPAPTAAPTAAETPPPASVPTAPPAGALCESFCYTDVASKAKSIAEACGYNGCKGCDLAFPGTSDTCVSVNAAAAAAATKPCRAWCYRNVANNATSIAEVCQYDACKGCDSFPDSAETCVLQCNPWCYGNVANNVMSLTEVCQFKSCHGCDSFPDSADTCESINAALEKTVGGCMPWCTADYARGTRSKAALCSFSKCQACAYDGSTCDRRRRARWIQPCEHMSAIECLKGVVDSQCNISEDASPKQCVDAARPIDNQEVLGEPIFDDEGLLTAPTPLAFV